MTCSLMYYVPYTRPPPRKKRAYGVDSWFSWAGFRLGLAALACLLPVQVATAQSITTVFNALKAFYDATDGDNWDTTSVPTARQLNSWCGVTYSGGDLEELELPSNGLSGSIPPELGDLTELDDLDLSDNALTGSIPSEVRDLDRLEVVRMLLKPKRRRSGTLSAPHAFTYKYNSPVFGGTLYTSTGQPPHHTK